MERQGGKFNNYKYSGDHCTVERRGGGVSIKKYIGDHCIVERRGGSLIKEASWTIV